jgi:nitroimidazol reductase NimA-like FMN-containing flavoprotein (pyridoxamine 5'-phosphate oxidase superfamily)
MLRAQAVLQAAPLAFVSVVEADAPYVVPMNFAYVPGSRETAGFGRTDALTGAPGPLGQIILHTGAGRKTKALADNPRVCMAVTADEAFIQGGTPCEHGFTYRSVLVEGGATLLGETAQRERALRTLVAKYDRAPDDAPFEEGILDQTIVYAVEIDSLTYKERSRPA